jgi:dTDP-4-amino-4,6-dideoxygalactose transaminase
MKISAIGNADICDGRCSYLRCPEMICSLRIGFLLSKKVECRPVWKPMHKQPVYANAPVYTNGVEENLFKKGFCLPAGPCVCDEDVQYIVDCIKESID